MSKRPKEIILEQVENGYIVHYSGGQKHICETHLCDPKKHAIDAYHKAEEFIFSLFTGTSKKQNQQPDIVDALLDLVEEECFADTFDYDRARLKERIENFLSQYSK